MGEIPDYIGLDVEGPLVNPASDFAWLTYDQLLSEKIRERFPREKCVDYDGKYDDGRYFHELGRSKRHSTGMWPPLSLALAALDGKTDDELIAFAEKTTQLNPGTDKLMKYLKKNFEEVYLITSSYPAVALKIAEKYNIPFNNIFTNGFQPLRFFNPSKKNFIEEVKERSPISKLSVDREELGNFLTEYQDVCGSLGLCYESTLKNITDYGGTIRSLLELHNQLFEKVSNPTLYKPLKYLFLSEEGVMGSHRKTDAMRSVDDNNMLWSFGGDGIVDGMPIDYADCGFSINMTNKHALPFSKMNFATTDVSNLIPAFDAMLDGGFDEPAKMKEKLDSEKLRVFTTHDIQQDIDAVVKANSETKKKLKELYVPVKV